MSKLRPYQLHMCQQIQTAWDNGARIVIGVTATGSGKTVTMAHMCRTLQGRGVIQAHRAELVGQLSLALAREGIRHNILANKGTVRAICDVHMQQVGAIFYDPRARWEVQSVDTCIRRTHPDAAGVRWVMGDEGHHYLADNKWGRAAALYPNARVLLMTATPCRSDGKGLGSHAHGIADTMVIGPGLAELMTDGYLVPYRVFAPRVTDLDLTDVHIGASGEFNQQEVARAVKRSRLIVGDVVNTYMTQARGKLGITFAVDVEHARVLTEAYNAAGVRAQLVTADTPDAERWAIMRKFAAREIHQLVNVDLFGEGVDVPGVECVSMARPTASFNLYCQQIGRMLRLNIATEFIVTWDSLTPDARCSHIASSEKPCAVLFDHVGNVRREFSIGDLKYSGLPEGFTAWTLDARTRRPRGSAGDAIPLRKCLKCYLDYERIYSSCPHCGTPAPEPADRSKPPTVDGDIYELDPAELARMRSEIGRIDGRAYVPQSVTPGVARAIMHNHVERQRAQAILRDAIAAWAGRYSSDSDSINYRRFYYTFGIDVASALTLGATEAIALVERINGPRLKLPALPKL